MPRITPNLWMDTEGLEAAEFYCSIFPNSKINAITHYGEFLRLAPAENAYRKDAEQAIDRLKN